MKINYLFILSIFLYSCHPEKRCHRTYNIEQSTSVYPVSNNYSLGDTIWVEINISDVFESEIVDGQGDKSNKTITLSNFDFHRSFINISKLTDSTQSYQAQDPYVWSNFNYILQKGTIVSEDELGPEFKLSYSENNYQFKIGIIPTVSGRYLLRLSRSPYNTIADQMEQNEQDILPDCNHELIGNVIFPINRQSNGTYNNNYNIFTQFMNPSLETDLNLIQTQCFNFIVN